METGMELVELLFLILELLSYEVWLDSRMVR